MRIDKRIWTMGCGAGVGAIISPVLKKYVEPTQGAIIPYMDSLGVWGTWHVFVPLATGAAAVILTQFTNLIRNDMMNGALAMYGFAALFSGVVSGLTETVSGARASASARMMSARPIARVASMPRTSITPTYTGISGKTIVS